MKLPALAAALLACSSAAIAQTQPAAVDPAGAARGMAQIAAPSGRDTTMGQVHQPGGAVTASGQLNSERGLRAGPQLNLGGRTAEAPASLSTPAQGRRPAAAVAIGGADRCDPQARPPARPDPDCARVLETRSAEFERPEANPLSPEQRLLAERRARTSDVTDGRAVARRAASGAIEDDDLAGQAIAASVLAASSKDADESSTPQTPAADLPAALIDLITGGQGLGGGVIVNPSPR